MSDSPGPPSPEPAPVAPDRESFWARRQRRRLELATQSWGRFLRGLAIEFAIVLVLVAVLAAVLWYVRG